jgi:uncharacterized membrane protein
MTLPKRTFFFAIVLLLIDIPWVLFYMRRVYHKLFQKLHLTLGGQLIGAFIAYFIMILAYPLIIEDKHPKKIIWRAIAVGLVVYGTYGFTLNAILPKYDIHMATTETIWGMVLYGTATLITQYISKRFNII